MYSNIIKVYANLIVAGIKTIEQVPEELQEEVQKIVSVLKQSAENK